MFKLKISWEKLEEGISDNFSKSGGVFFILLCFMCLWFDLSLVGGVFEKIAYVLPFVHGVEMEKALLLGDLRGAVPHLLPVLLYSAFIVVAAVFCFLEQKKRV